MPYCLACEDGDPPKGDQVYSPSHYTQGDIECIDAIKAQLTPEEYRGFLKGTIAAYLWRERLKGGAESIAKAHWYMKKLMEETNEN